MALDLIPAPDSAPALCPCSTRRSGLTAADVTWVVKHGHIGEPICCCCRPGTCCCLSSPTCLRCAAPSAYCAGICRCSYPSPALSRSCPFVNAAGDAFFDLDAAQFLLEELQSQRRAAGQEHTAGRQKQEHVHHQRSSLQQQQQQPQHGQQPADAAAATSSSGGSGVLGHAVGPRWTHQLPPGAGAAAGGSGAVELEYGCEIARIQLAHQQQQQQQEGPAGNLRGEGEPGSEPGGASATPPQALQLTLTNGKQLEADLVLLAIGVQPALEWVPPSLERAGDGGLRVNRQAGAGS